MFNGRGRMERNENRRGRIERYRNGRRRWKDMEMEGDG